jgi:hypothetical protein
MRYLPHYFTLPPSRMHRWLSARLAALRPGDRLAIIAPRDSAKSTYLSFAYPLYCAVHGTQPYIVLVAETQEQARKYLRALRRELEHNARLRCDYPEAVQPDDQWNIDRLTLQGGVEIEALGTGQNIRGRKNCAQRPTLVVLDDPQDRKHLQSAAQRQADWAWLTQDLLNVGTPHTVYLAAGTALHREAVVDRLMQQPGWQGRRFAAIEAWPANMHLWQHWEALYTNPRDPLRQQHAEAFYRAHRRDMHRGAVVCWPQREDLYTLMKLRADIGRTAFEAEKQGQPHHPELCEWPPEYFEDAVWFDTWPPRLAVRTMALDPSKGREAGLGDYAALVRVGIDTSGLAYVEADLRREPVERLVRRAAEQCAEFAPDGFGCEATAWQELLAAAIEAEFQRRGMLAARCVPIDNPEPKLVRIRRLGPWLAQRRLRFKSGSPGTRLLVEQLQDFPLADHDDGPDALEMALRLAARLLAPGGQVRCAGRLTRE